MMRAALLLVLSAAILAASAPASSAFAFDTDPQPGAFGYLETYGGGPHPAPLPGPSCVVDCQIDPQFLPEPVRLAT